MNSEGGVTDYGLVRARLESVTLKIFMAKRDFTHLVDRRGLVSQP